MNKTEEAKWRVGFLASGPNNPAENSCSRCVHEGTCGYSHLATTGERSPFSFGPCVLGAMSNGHPFFEASN